MRGQSILSENLLNIISILVSIALIVITINMIFGEQANVAYSSSFKSIALDIASSIDRANAIAGSQVFEIEIPKGMKIDVLIANKEVRVKFDKGVTSAYFASMLNAGPYYFKNPKYLCIFKNLDDGRVIITPTKCKCKENDGECDLACIIQGICDPDCKKKEKDFLCTKLCASNGDGICDEDCYSNFKDGVCDIDCINESEEDSICDPDCDNVKDGVCDIDCLKKYSNNNKTIEGICDPDCKPVDKNNDGFEDKKDGFCYTACAKEKKGDVIVLPKDGICDLDCNETNSICDPDCRKDEDCIDKCAVEGESCEKIRCCEGYVCCPGTKKCVKENPFAPSCCGNGKCEVSPIVKELYSKIEKSWHYSGGTHSFKDFELPFWDKNSLPKDWENFYTCEEDCSPEKTRGGDLVCSRVSLGSSRDADCPAFCKPGKGKYAYDCCYPDMSAHPSYWGISYKPCPYVSLVQSQSDGICMQTKGDGCDPDCKNDEDLCDPDCCPFNSKSPCPSSPGCYCPTRVKMKNFKKAPCYYGTSDESWENDNPFWGDNAIEVCSDSAISFLDRRGWDIRQVAITIKEKPPLGWGFDYSRYATIRNKEGKCSPQEKGCFAQPASLTIEAQEYYNLSYDACCGYGECCGGDVDYVGEKCQGLGFCVDHAVALLSILRTLGVPPYDVYATFTSCMHKDCSPIIRHAFVVYYCDPDLPGNLKLEECKGNWNKWLILDPTNHFIKPLEGSYYCQHLCLVWNDYGIYPLINATVNGVHFGGKYNSTLGYPFPVKGKRAMNCKVDKSCLLNKDNKKGLCQLLGINCFKI